MTDLHPYAEERDGRWYVYGQRVSIASLANAWKQGRSPETIAQDFPVLTLAEVYGAIAFYLDHQDAIELQTTEDTAAFKAERTAQRAADPERYANLKRRFDAMKEHDATAAS